MIEQATLSRPTATENDEANAKRRQIMDGATKVFLAQGFRPGQDHFGGIPEDRA